MAFSAITAAVTTTSRYPILSSTTFTLHLIKRHRFHNHHHRSRNLITTMSSSASTTPKLKTTAPYGSWPSPITSDVVSGASKGLGGIAVDSHGRLFWLESRPTESGYVNIYILIFL